MLIKVRHNIEVAHRLYLTKGKCEAIHGHSMWVTLFLEGHINSETGMAEDTRQQVYRDLEFGAIKRSFRAYLDSQYDHRVLLHASDPFARPIIFYGADSRPSDEIRHLPGLQSTPGDPTTENIAKWIYEWAQNHLEDSAPIRWPVAKVEVWETSVNGVEYAG